VICGVLAVLAGVACLGLAALQLVVPQLAQLADLPPMPIDLRSAVMGAAMGALIGLALVTAGIGAARKRRWSRPVMLALSWTWLLGGVMTMLLLPAMLGAALSSAGGGALEGGVWLVQLVVLSFGALFFVLVPASLVWIFRDPDLRLTLEARDPGASWTEACPPAVFALSLGLGAYAVLSPLLALRPAVPLFGHLLTGWPGGAVLVASGAVSAWLAQATYRLKPVGWWGATLFTGASGISLVWTAIAVEPDEWLRAMGYSADDLAGAATLFGGPSGIWTAAAATLAGLAYMVAIRKEFRR
jgi:hypothetical protein